MPVYDYRCARCEYIQELNRKYEEAENETPLDDLACEQCQANGYLKRLPCAPKVLVASFRDGYQRFNKIKEQRALEKEALRLNCNVRTAWKKSKDMKKKIEEEKKILSTRTCGDSKDDI